MLSIHLCLGLTMRPVVSVIIPVFNRPRGLADALRSVSEQSFSDWEVVVVDDCSSDESADVAMRMGAPEKLRVIRHEKNQGSSAARNTGILHARGRYVSFLDSDDAWHPDKLARQVELVESDPDPATVFCATQTRVLIGAGRERVRPRRAPASGEDWSEWLYVADGFAQTNSFFLSRDLAMRVLFDPDVRRHVDNLFFLKAGALGARYRLIEQPLSIWNHDLRPDRVSLSPLFLEQSRQFLARAGDLLTVKARMAFQVRYLGPLLVQENPVEAFRVFVRAAAKRAVGPRELLAVAARVALPTRWVDMLRKLAKV